MLAGEECGRGSYYQTPDVILIKNEYVYNWPIEFTAEWDLNAFEWLSG